jgi:hypothetical protein
MFHLLPQRRLLIWSRPRTVASATPVVIVRSRSSVLSVPSRLLLHRRQKLCYRRPAACCCIGGRSCAIGTPAACCCIGGRSCAIGAQPLAAASAAEAVLSAPSRLLLHRQQKLCYRRPGRLLLRQRGKTWLRLATDPKRAAGPPFWGCDFTLHALGYQIRRLNGGIQGRFWRFVGIFGRVSCS